MGKLSLQDLISHDSLVSSALLGWLWDPHITPAPALGLGHPTSLLSHCHLSLTLTL